MSRARPLPRLCPAAAIQGVWLSWLVSYLMVAQDPQLVEPRGSTQMRWCGQLPTPGGKSTPKLRMELFGLWGESVGCGGEVAAGRSRPALANLLPKET